MAYESVDELNRRSLLELVHGLDDLGEENAAYIEAFLGRGSKEASLERYKEIIRRALHYDPEYQSKLELDLLAVSRSYEAYYAASSDPAGLLELMIHGMKLSVRIIKWANARGEEVCDKFEELYDALEDWYEQACVGITNLRHDYDVTVFLGKMAELCDAMADDKWGCYEELSGIYDQYLEELE